MTTISQTIISPDHLARIQDMMAPVREAKERVTQAQNAVRAADREYEEWIKTRVVGKRAVVSGPALIEAERIVDRGRELKDADFVFEDAYFLSDRLDVVLYGHEAHRAQPIMRLLLSELTRLQLAE